MKWEIVAKPRLRFLTEVGNKVAGEVMAFEPYQGSSTKHVAECGFLDLKLMASAEQEVIRLPLDKPALRDAVLAAYPEPGDVLGVKLKEKKEGKKDQANPYNVYEVWRGIPDEGAAPDAGTLDSEALQSHFHAAVAQIKADLESGIGAKIEEMVKESHKFAQDDHKKIRASLKKLQDDLEGGIGLAIEDIKKHIENNLPKPAKTPAKPKEKNQ